MTDTPEQSESRPSRPSGLYHVVLLDVDDNYTPPERPLVTLARIGDVCMVRIGNEDDDSGTRSTIAEAFVSWRSLVAALRSFQEAEGKP